MNVNTLKKKEKLVRYITVEIKFSSDDKDESDET